MRCHDCGVDRPLLVTHHIIPKGRGGSNDPGNLVRICHNCHADRHHGPNADSLPAEMNHSPESNSKRAATMRERWTDPEYRQKTISARMAAETPEVSARRAASVSRALKGKPFTPEHRAALSEAHKGIPVTPATREKLSAAMKGRAFTDEHRARISASLRARGVRPPGYDGTIEPTTKTCPSDGAR